MRTGASWLVLGALTAAVALALDLVGLTSATLFAALLVGLAVALARPGRVAFPRPTFVAAQAVLGVTLGAYLEPDALQAVGGAWLPVALVTAGTLLVSMAVGLVLERRTELDRPTATLGMIAGGASGIVGMADEIGGDDRLVAFMQYLRVLVTVLLTPLLAAAWGGGGSGEGPGEALLATPADWLLTAAVAPGGALLARRLNVPAGTLMGPMVLAGALTLARVEFVVPPVVRELAFALIGLQVGLRFTVDTVRQMGRLLAPVLAGILALLVACFGLAVVLHLLSDISLRDAYLATTPGGIYAVLAVAFGSGGNITFIVAVQSLRVVVSVVLAPLAVRRLARSGRPEG
jgi:membrane AbrB-like protein